MKDKVGLWKREERCQCYERRKEENNEASLPQDIRGKRELGKERKYRAKKGGRRRASSGNHVKKKRKKGRRTTVFCAGRRGKI